MRRLLVVAALVAIAVSIVGTSAGGASVHEKSPKKIQVVQTYTSQQIAGNLVLISEVDTSPKGAMLGTALTYCVLVDPPQAECVSTHIWTKGQISAQGPYNPSASTQEVAIVGGTGAYDGARGSIAVQISSDQKTANAAYTLTQ